MENAQAIALIDALGGPTAVAKRLNLPEPGGPQRVCNWKRRGIPPSIRLDHADVFAEAAAKAAAAPTSAVPAEEARDAA